MSSRREAERLLSKAAGALRERLAQPEQMSACPHGVPHRWLCEICDQPEQERYTTPTQRQPLTDEKIEEICWTEVDQRLRSFARGSEAKLKEKNA